MEDSATQDVTISRVFAPTNRGIDYEKLSRDFGSSLITKDVIDRVEALTHKPAHRFLKRNIFFSHRDFDIVLNDYQNNFPFYLYTGRGPSSQSMHMGHLVPFIFCRYLQEAFKVPIVIQITDDEKFLHKELNLEETYVLGKENVKDIIACGFDPASTFIFSNLDYITGCKKFYETILKIQRLYNINQARSIFGFDESDNVGKYAFPAIQAAPSFSDAFPHLFPSGSNYTCLIPCAIDQDPYFRLTRDIAPRLGYKKPALLHSTFIPALQGARTKMSASDLNSSIYLSDSPEVIKKKINKYAFSGGCSDIDQHRIHGADITVDVSIAYLTYFLDDDDYLERIKKEYASGSMLTGEVKEIIIKELQKIVAEHQQIRASITDADVAQFIKF